MRGRLYDPVLGRFLSADPFVQFPNNTQSYNRYSYVLNNPLSFTDPSGYFLSGLKNFFKKHLRTIVAIGVGFLTAGLATAAFIPGTTFALTGGGVAGAIAGGAAGAFAGTLAATGSLETAVTSGALGALSGGLGLGNRSWYGRSRDKRLIWWCWNHDCSRCGKRKCFCPARR